ncbi:hypothetical protein E1176_10715 [Fulvivirga sp. RKSG066]|uniref:hypothetical protein n=1 Tax=Fulvivirga aurantia TaxID=2529383 RepID=UPI0012BB5126|nr:hypothetical protein [Fulvivirga aurantia]MTI21490.1 hypothetical protein [Fulvivirga aurantia]
MIKIFGVILLVLGAVGLVLGILGIFGSVAVGISPWALAILGLIFFTSSIGLLKRQKDTDDTS